jgi:hypothetical protein
MSAKKFRLGFAIEINDLFKWKSAKVFNGFLK